MSRSHFEIMLPNGEQILMSCHAELQWLQRHYGVRYENVTGKGFELVGSDEAISRLSRDYEVRNSV